MTAERDDSTKGLNATRSCTLWLHSDVPRDVLFNEVHLPEAQEGDVVELSKQGAGPHASLLFHVPAPERDGPKKTQMQVSVSNEVAQAFDLQNREHVILSKLPCPLPTHYCATHCEIYFKNAYVGRSDLHRMVTQLINTCAWVGQNITLPACRFKARLADLVVDGVKRRSALITENTQIVFRSHSAKYYIFLQVSSECWTFDLDGSLFFEKMIGLFLPELFARWAGKGTNHIVSLVLFSRIIYDDDELEKIVDHQELSTDSLGRHYRDVYKVVSDFEPHKLWLTVLSKLKEEFLDYHERILLHLGARTDNTLAGHLSAAHEGNVLEAINLAITSFEKNHIDRDLLRTGLSCIIVTCGTCHFDVCQNLLRLTRERMRSYGICLDCVSLNKIPLHSVPVFRYEGYEPAGQPYSAFTSHAASNETDKTSSPSDLRKLVKSSSLQIEDTAVASSPAPALPLPVPLARTGKAADPLYYDGTGDEGAKMTFNYVPPDWLDATFYSRWPDRPYRVDRFMPRCNMNRVHMLGLVDSTNATISIPLLKEQMDASPIVPDDTFDEKWKRQKERENLDIIACGGMPLATVSPLASAKPSGTTVASSLSPDEDDDLFAKVPDIVHRKSPVPSIAARIAKPPPLEPRGRPLSRQDGDREETPGRGRTLGRPSPSRTASPSRPLTPTVRRETSLASTTRSVSATTATNIRKPFTPALISRFAAQAKSGPVVPASQSETASNGSNKSSWTSFFLGKGHRSTSSATVVPRVVSDALSAKATPSSPLLSAADGPDIEQRRSPTPTQQSLAAPIAIRIKGAEPAQHSTLNQLISASYDSATAGATPPNVTFPVQSIRPSASSSDADGHRRLSDTRAPFLENPSNPQRRRGADRLVANPFKTMREDHAVDWKSLCTPVVLPLTSSWFPSSHDLSRNYAEAKYALPISLQPASVLLRSSTSIEQAGGYLIRELVYQRLQQNFQIVTPAAIEHAYAGDGDLRTGNYRDVLLNNIAGQGRTIYLTLSNHIHGLRYNRESHEVEVSIFARKQPWLKEDVTYRFHLWPRFGDSFEVVQADFAYPNVDVFEWTRLDRVVCGLESKLKSSLGYWRTRYALLPAPIANKETIVQSMSDVLDENSDEEEIRVAGLQKMFTLLDAARFNPKPESNIINPSLSYTFTSCLPAVYVREEAKETVENQLAATVTARGTKRIPQNEALENVAQAMRAEDSGLEFQNRRWNLRSYNDIFIGNEFVDWLQANFMDVKTREDAIQLGIRLQQQGLFQHVNTGGATANEERKLLECGRAYTFYLLSPQYVRERQRRARPDLADKETSVTADQSAPTYAPDAEPRVPMTRCVVVDLDAGGRSDRAETAWLHYDVPCNPDTAYHLQFDWLSTPRVIEEQISSIMTRVERYGLKLVESMIGQVSDASHRDPLLRPVRVQFAMAPPRESADLLIYKLAQFMGYVLDYEADSAFPTEVKMRYTFSKHPIVGTQWIHSCGAAFLQALPDHSGLLFLHNRLHVGHAEIGSVSSGAGVEQLLRDLRALCQDSERLGAFWQKHAPPVEASDVKPSPPTVSAQQRTVSSSSLSRMLR